MNLEGLELGKVLSCDINLKIREGKFRNDIVMIKEYNISEMSIEEKKRLRNELKILEIINSRYLVHHYANLMFDNKLLIVLENFPGKTLREYINLFQSRKKHFNEKVYIILIYFYYYMLDNLSCIVQLIICTKISTRRT